MKQKHRILLLGSAGYLGKTLMTQLQQTTHVVVPTHRSKAYFTGSYHYDFWTDTIHPLVEHHRIDTVIIAASMAYEAANLTSNVKLFQQQAAHLIRDCQQCRVIYISSDGVFDGKKGNYAESDVPTPITPYGRNLHSIEEMVQKLCSNYCIIRPSYLYGYSLGQLDHRLFQARTQLLAGEHLTYFSDMIKSPMEINQAARAIMLLTCSDYVGIMHVAGIAMSVYAFYREAISSLGIACERLRSGEMPIDFLQPRDTSLDITLMKNLLEIEPLSVYELLNLTHL